MKGAYVKDAGYERPRWDKAGKKELFTFLSVPKGYAVREITKPANWMFKHRTIQIRLKKVV